MAYSFKGTSQVKQYYFVNESPTKLLEGIISFFDVPGRIKLLENATESIHVEYEPNKREFIATVSILTDGGG
jgi:hypothetical protein